MQPLGPSRDHDPEKDPAELVRAWTEWPLEILLEKLSPGAPSLSPVPGLLTPGTLGIVCHVGFGLLGGADREQ